MEVEHSDTYYALPITSGAGKRLHAFSGPVLQQGSGVIGDLYSRYLQPTIRQSVLPRTLEMAGAIVGDLAQPSHRQHKNLRQMVESHGKRAAVNIVSDLGRRLAAAAATTSGTGAKKPRKRRRTSAAVKTSKRGAVKNKARTNNRKTQPAKRKKKKKSAVARLAPKRKKTDCDLTALF